MGHNKNEIIYGKWDKVRVHITSRLLFVHFHFDINKKDVICSIIYVHLLCTHWTVNDFDSLTSVWLILHNSIKTSGLITLCHDIDIESNDKLTCQLWDFYYLFKMVNINLYFRFIFRVENAWVHWNTKEIYQHVRLCNALNSTVEMFSVLFFSFFVLHELCISSFVSVDTFVASQGRQSMRFLIELCGRRKFSEWNLVCTLFTSVHGTFVRKSNSSISWPQNRKMNTKNMSFKWKTPMWSVKEKEHISPT